MDHRQNIPWLKLVQFHKEVVRRDEESFFSIPLGLTNTDRWTALHNFDPDTLAGPWDVVEGSLSSQVFEQTLRADDSIEVFIGGPCWIQWKRSEGKDWQLYWQPLIYREARLKHDFDGGGYRIVPQSGNWDLSPMVYRFMENRGITTEVPFSECLHPLLEKVQKMHDDQEIGLAEALINVFGKEVPDLGEELKKPFPKGKVQEPPSQWILFSPPQKQSPMTVHLMRDYDQLEKMLTLDGTKTGGLSLLENIPVTSETTQSDVLPIVPLNESQCNAVAGMLTSNPVTVISGPPGCGKSQVVVSLLLNAWARGMSVLFASNNNQAVNVVKERIEHFEHDFPVAVRAGARGQSNLEDTLRRTLNMAASSSSTSNTDSNSAKIKRAKLLDEKQKLQQMIDSQVPQRIDQSLRSALKAYGEAKKITQGIRDQKKQLIQQLKNIGYTITPETFASSVVEPLKVWLHDISATQRQISQEERDRLLLQSKASGYEMERNNTLKPMGLDATAVNNWNWLTSGAGPEVFSIWLERYRKLLGEPLERVLQPIEWKESYDFWDSAASAEEWSDAAKRLAKDIRQACSGLGSQVREIEALKEKFDQRHAEVIEKGIPGSIEIPASLLEEWLSFYSMECSLPKGNFDWWPWSERSKLRRKMVRVEKESRIRTAFPLIIWRNIGELNEGGRNDLSIYIELTRIWIAIRTEWETSLPIRQRIEKELASLQSRLVDLRIESEAAGSDLERWKEVAAAIDSSVRVSEIAAEAWRSRDLATSAIRRIRDCVDEFDSVESGNPLKEVWSNGAGQEFYQALKLLEKNPCAENVVSARTTLYGGQLFALISAWSEAQKQETARCQALQQISEIPSESFRIAEWWNQAPRHLSNVVMDSCSSERTRLPHEEEHLLKQHLKNCDDWVASWIQFDEEMRPREEQNAKGEAKWALQYLNEACNSIPEGPDRENARSGINEAILSGQDDWPIESFPDLFKSYNPRAIQGKIDTINTKLEQLSFELAKDSWRARLAGDRQLQTDLQTLLIRYRQQQGRIDAGSYDLFAKVLTAIPIWITTAQSPQSIPMQAEMFDLVVIDEATQCTLTNLLPLIYRAKRLAVIGDREQLPAIPTIGPSAQEALAIKLDVVQWMDSLGHADNDVYTAAVGCLPRKYSDVIALNEHYRSNPLIIGFSNQHVYQKRLKIRKDPTQVKKVPFGAGVHGCNIQGVCQRGDKGKSWRNEAEIEIVCQLVRQLKEEEGYGGFSIGIVTPFSQQQRDIESKLIDLDLLKGVTVGTAHRFQGDERDVMIFSPVVAKGISDSAVHWVETPRNLINVAVTRAREALFVVGDFNACRQQPGILGELIRYVETVTLLRDTSCFELDLFSWMVLKGYNPTVHQWIADIEVDFVLSHQGTRLAIEVDGSQHAQQVAQDQARDAFLMGQGYKVLRVSPRAIEETPAIVLRDIARELEIEMDDEE